MLACISAAGMNPSGAIGFLLLVSLGLLSHGHSAHGATGEAVLA